MTPSQIVSALNSLLSIRQPVFIWGAPGVGKSQIVAQVAQARGLALRDIPVGETISYSDIARQIGAPKSVRAVAVACAANTLAVAIPCHRVVRNDGDLSGYRWGIERKRALLEKESAA